MTVKASKEQLTKFIAQVELRLAVFNKVREILAGFDGKKYSKRMATAIEKELPDFTVHYGKSFSWYEIMIWGNGISYNNALRMNIGYFSQGENFDLIRFNEHNRCYVLDKERIPEYKATLANYDRIVAEFHEAEEVFKKAEASLGCIRFDLKD